MIPELGFETTYEVGNLLSIAHLFPKNERCGIYCLKFSNNQFYIGRAIDFVRRFVQHRKTYDDIVEVSFFKVPPNLQSEPERKLIHKAEAKGFKLRNIVETSVTYADSDFDELFLPSEQEKWLITAEVKEFIYRISGENIDNQRIRYTTKFNKLKSRPDFDRLVEVLKLYIQKVIPFYRQTEMSFWSVSCLPSTKAQFGQRLFVINMNEMECLVVLCDKEFPNMTRGFLTTSQKAIEEQYGSLAKFEKKYCLEWEIRDTDYRCAGSDQIGVVFESIGNLEKLLRDEKFCRTLRIFNLRLMRKRANLNSKFHCLDLADLIV